MEDDTALLWPYSPKVAVLAAPVIWIGLLAVLAFVVGYLGWSEAGSRYVLVGVLIAGLLPVLLCVADKVVSSRAVLDIKGVKIDFSQTQLAASSIMLPENIGRPEPLVADSSPMRIVSALETAAAHEVVRVDLRDGSGWWMTRLLGLCAGSVRVGSPKVVVFVGMKEGIHDSFLGWSPTQALLYALIEDSREHGPLKVTYGQVYRRAVWLAKQMGVFAGPPEMAAPPMAPVGPVPAPYPVQPFAEVTRYLNHVDYKKLGEGALEQILMDLCAQYTLETPPDRLTLGRLREQFGHCLCETKVDLDAPQKEQILALLSGDIGYVALVRGGRYHGLVERALVERQVLKQLLARVGK